LCDEAQEIADKAEILTLLRMTGITTGRKTVIRERLEVNNVYQNSLKCKEQKQMPIIEIAINQVI
jgi:hypothetical protein